MDISIVLVWILIFLLWFVYEKFQKNFREFDGYGIAYLKPWEGVGNFFRLMTLKMTLHDVLEEAYRKFPEQKVLPGISFLNQRVFIVRDPSLIKNITVRDFDSFVNHDKTVDEHIDPILGKSLVMLRDESWRSMRTSLSPIFTSSKMKMMFGIVSEAADDFVAFCGEQESRVIDCKRTFVRFAADGICTAVLGFKSDCVRNDKSEVYEMVEKVTKPPPSSAFKMLLFVLAKWLYRLLNLRLVAPELRDFFRDAIVRVMREREANGVFRPDVIELLMRAKRGQLERAEKEAEVNEAELANFSANTEYQVRTKAPPIVWTDDHFIAQGHLFFAAGLGTSSILFETTAYYLAVNRTFQEEIIREVDAVESVSYEAIHKMKMLDMFVSEVLRMWATPVIGRECNKDYKLDIGNGVVLQLKPGDLIQIPIWSIHRDERFFANPEQFDPLRFSDERKGSIVSGSYMPFGSGPRICIASRFALMEVKVLIFKLLSKYTVEACDKTPKKLEIEPSLTEFNFKGGIFVELKPRGDK